MIEVVRVGWSDPRALELRVAMDAEMDVVYAPRHTEFPERSALISAVLSVEASEIVSSVLAVDADGGDGDGDSANGGSAVGHAGLRLLPDGSGEVRKVVVTRAARGRGISKLLMAEIEAIARESAITRLVLQTGDLQPEAIALYEGLGYRAIPVYGGYDVIPGALCYEKVLT